MSQVFFDELELPQPDVNLEIGSGSHAQQTARIMPRCEPMVLDYKPDGVVAPGDVNSTVVCAWVAGKLGVRVAHVESGLRSFDPTASQDAVSLLLIGGAVCQRFAASWGSSLPSITTTTRRRIFTCSGQRAIVGIQTLTVLQGRLSPRVLGLVMEWAALHQAELMSNWDLARQQAPLQSIQPLE